MAGTAAPSLQPSTDVFTLRPLELLATPGPVVNSPAAKVILWGEVEVARIKSAVAMVQTIVSVAAVNTHVDVKVAVPDAGIRVPIGLALPLK